MATSAIGPHTKHSHRAPCPKCGKDNCITFADGGTLWLRTESPRRTPSGIGWYHPGDGPDWRDGLYPPTPPPERPPEPPPPDPALVDRGLRFLLARCPLAPEHRAELRRRGLADAHVDAAPFGSLPDDGPARDALAAALVDALGPGAFGSVPGLHADPTGAPRLNAHPGLLVGVERDGLLVGVKIRPDDPAVRADGKYRWLSSPKLPGGAGSGAPSGVVFPAAWVAGAPVGRALVVEGVLKGYVAANKTGLPVIVIPGATITADVARLATRLGATELVLAFDNDRATNPNVARAEAGLAEELVAAGYPVLRATWPDAHKGLDDALATGVLPLLEPYRPADEPVPAACSALLASKDAELAEWKRRYDDLRAFHSAALAAHRSPHLGPERSTATAMVIDLAAAPRGEWRPMPHKRIAEDAGVSPRAVPRHLKLTKPLLDGAVELKTTWVPETVDPATGAVSGGHRMTFARLVAEPLAALKVIATGTPATGQHKNGHGGRRRCPDCGDAGVVRKWVDYCAGCGQELDHGESRTAPGDRQDVVNGRDPAPDGRPPLAAAAAAGNGQDVTNGDGLEGRGGDRRAGTIHVAPSSVPVLSSAALASSHKGAPSTLVDVRASLAEADHATDRERARRAREDLTARLERIAREKGREPVPKPTPAPMAMPLPPAYGDIPPDHLDPWRAP